MTINYTWIINKVDCKTSVGNMADYVVNIHWSLLGTDSNSSYSNSIQGLTSFVEKSDDTYILIAEPPELGGNAIQKSVPTLVFT